MPPKAVAREGHLPRRLGALVACIAFAAGFGAAQIPPDAIRDLAVWAWRPDGLIRLSVGKSLEAVVLAVATVMTTITVAKLRRWWRRRR